MIKVALIDDDDHELTLTKDLVNQYFDSRSEKCGISGFTSPSDFLKTAFFKGGSDKAFFDIYILDVLMPDMDGIELGKKIREKDSTAVIIYLSTSADFALESFEARALYYLIKPVEQKKFSHVMDIALSGLSGKADAFVNIRTKESIERLNLNDIMYVELKNRRAHYCLKDRDVTSVMLTSSFTAANADILADPRFVSCGASFIINMSFIQSVGKSGNVTISMGNAAKEIYIAKRAVSSLNAAWMDYCLGERA